MKMIEVRKDVYLDRPLMTTIAAGMRATETLNKLQSIKNGPFRKIEVPPTTVRIDKDGIRNSVSVIWARVDPTAKRCQLRTTGQ